MSRVWGALALGLLLTTGCNFRRDKLAFTGGAEPTFANVQRYILEMKCVSCHSPGGKLFDLTTYEAIMAAEGLVIPKDPLASKLYDSVLKGRMPKGLQPLVSAEADLVRDWILAGAAKDGDLEPPPPPPAPTYEWISKYVFAKRCVGCHDGTHDKTTLDLRTYESLMAYSGELMLAVEPGIPELSLLFTTTNTGNMPPRPPALEEAAVAAISEWITNGAEKGSP